MSGNLADQANWVQRVLGVMLSAPAQSAGAGKADAVDREPDIPGAQTLQRRLDELEPAYLRVMRLDPPERGKLSASLALAQETLQAGNLGRCAASLDTLEKLLGTQGNAARPVVRPSDDSVGDIIRSEGQLVAYRKMLLEWDAAKRQAREQLDGLKQEIASRAPALAESAKVLDGVMLRLNDGLSEAIDGAIKARDSNVRVDLHNRAAELARSYLVTVNFDPVFKLIDQNHIRPLTLRAVLGGALKHMVSALPV